MTRAFPEPGSRAEVEEGATFTPRFDANGLVSCIAVDAADGQVLMLAHMNAESLARTLETGEADRWANMQAFAAAALELLKRGLES